MILSEPQWIHNYGLVLTDLCFICSIISTRKSDLMKTKLAQIHSRHEMLIHCNKTVSFVANVLTASPLMTAGAKENLGLL